MSILFSLYNCLKCAWDMSNSGLDALANSISLAIPLDEGDKGQKDEHVRARSPENRRIPRDTLASNIGYYFRLVSDRPKHKSLVI